MFTCKRPLLQVAQLLLNNLLVVKYIRWLYPTNNGPTNIVRYNRQHEWNTIFTASSLSRSADTEWDAQQCRVIQEEDELLREQIECEGQQNEVQLEFDTCIFGGLGEDNIDNLKKIRNEDERTAERVATSRPKQSSKSKTRKSVEMRKVSNVGLTQVGSRKGKTASAVIKENAKKIKLDPTVIKYGRIECKDQERRMYRRRSHFT